MDVKGGGAASGNGGRHQGGAAGALPGREQAGQGRGAVQGLHTAARGSFHTGKAALPFKQGKVGQQAAGADDHIGLHAQPAAGHKFGAQRSRLVKGEG